MPGKAGLSQNDYRVVKRGSPLQFGRKGKIEARNQLKVRNRNKPARKSQPKQLFRKNH